MFIQDMAQFGSDNGVCTLGGDDNDVFLGTNARMPDGDGPFTTLIATSGITPIIVHNRTSIPGYERPGAQLVVRAKNPVAAFDKCQEWYNLIFSVRNQFINGYWYLDILIQQQPFDGGIDNQGRTRAIINMIATKRPDQDPDQVGGAFDTDAFDSDAFDI